jgi:Cdc6-like AAA superfamily ATPase
VETQESAHGRYGKGLLDAFSVHHEFVFQATKQWTSDQEWSKIQSGDGYDRYENRAADIGDDPRSQRRISTFLKHLELLDRIEADYHYGGSKGKTREIRFPEGFLPTRNIN